uniref:DUF8156 domain-containing protein n=1 Tax=Caldiarchaeum subterraneum TaxID=311458 RepID=E6N364_CALS0|nr:hypothetical protein HGMM_F22F09C20 [Candidatus Caldarchaeum subterraneum]
MGRNAATYRQLLEEEVRGWSGFREALRREEREAFDNLVNQAFRYVHAGTMNPLRRAFDNLAMSLLLSHEERLRQLEESLRKTMQIDNRYTTLNHFLEK